jgi:phosphoribosylaminoimidazole carboxylase (NCAIR synthetase)
LKRANVIETILRSAYGYSSAAKPSAYDVVVKAQGKARSHGYDGIGATFAAESERASSAATSAQYERHSAQLDASAARHDEYDVVHSRGQNSRYASSTNAYDAVNDSFSSASCANQAQPRDTQPEGSSASFV